MSASVQRGAGSLQPFELDEGTVIVDRNTGATLSDNLTTNSSSGSVVTVTAKSNSNIVAVGAGVGVSLGVPLIAALIGCAMIYSQLRKARKQLHSIETKGNYQDHHETSVLTSSNGHQSSYGGSMHKPYSYSADRSPPPAPTESPFNSVLVEAPTEREVAMADSRPMQKP
ncbi:hypothetical protein PRZ48_009393 [Zasmidium cellare]|uniref:Uncharacterized protein n=1 Tax=Zasmidium cellare TaxID=395010 RepID=A0ABR0ECM6_ZASCE|nr:hypothetical protein PRZ48_009393 [Zasmidium cellare]